MVRKRKFTGDWLDGMLEGRELEAGLDAVSQIIGCLIVLITTGILWLADPAWIDWKVLTTAAMVTLGFIFFLFVPKFGGLEFGNVSMSSRVMAIPIAVIAAYLVGALLFAD